MQGCGSAGREQGSSLYNVCRRRRWARVEKKAKGPRRPSCYKALEDGQP